MYEDAMSSGTRARFHQKSEMFEDTYNSIGKNEIERLNGSEHSIYSYYGILI